MLQIADLIMEKGNAEIHVGQRLRELLSERGLSQSDVARKIGVVPQRVNSILRKENITTDTMQAIMTAAGITWSEMGKEALDLPENVMNLYQQLVDCKNQVSSLQQQLQGKDENVAQN